MSSNISIVAQSSFNPSDVSGLKLWLRSDTGIVLSGNIVDQWKDISGNNNHAFQPNSSIKPTWYASDTILNNYPAVKFDGVGSRLETMYTQPDAYSIFIVYAHRNGTNGSFYSTNQSGYPLQRNSIIWPNSNVAPYGLGVGDLLNAKNLYVDVHDFLNDKYSTYLNGIQSGSSSDPISKSGGVFNIGSGGGEPINGSIAEFLIYDKPLSDSLRSIVEKYLMNRYAPPVKLGNDFYTCAFPVTLKAKKKHFINYQWQDGSTDDSLVINSPGIFYVTTTDFFNKTSSDTITVLLSPPTYTVSLANDTVICSGQQVVLNAGPANLTYSWSVGSTSNSITVSTQGQYSVTVKDCSGNITTDSIKVMVQASPVFNFGGKDTIICSNTNFVLDPGFGTSSSLTFHWQDNLSSSTHSVTSNGQYYLDVTDNLGCKHSDTINILIDNSINNISLGPDLSLCAGNSIALTSGAAPSLTYTWSNGSNNSSILVNTSGQYSVVVTNTNNCVAKDTINVTILGQAPVADFSSNTGCINSLVSFTNLSAPVGSGTITAYSWNFGDISSSSNTSTLINPSHTYTNTGTYTISLDVITDASCQQTITKIIQIFPKPSVNFSSGLSCQNDNTLFFNSSSSVSGYSITSYNWNFGDPGSANTSTVSSPTHTFTNSANYTIKLVATNNVGCKDSLISIIAVKPQVKADFTYTSPCANTSTLFHDNSIAPLPASQFTRTWNFSVGTNTPVGLTVSKTFTSSGVYSVTLTVAGNSGTNLCSSKITKLITIFEPPTADFTVPSFCAKDTVTATNLSSAQSGVISSYDWKLLNISNTSSVQNPTLTAAAAGTYSVRLTVTNSFTCKDSVTKPVTVFGLPNIDFTTNPVAYYYINSPVSFVPTYTAVNSYFWNVVGITTLTVQSPSVVFNTQGTYTVFLNSQDLNGCRNSKTKTLQVSKRYLDLAILNVNTARDNDGFITLKADIANYGSVPVSTFDIHYRISDAGNIKETWNGTFNPNSIYQYTFVAKSVSQKDNTNNITCVEIEKVNGVTDENTTNNDLCNTLNTDDISVSNPIPNPAEGDVTLPVILNRDMEYTISIYNSMGQIVYEETTEKGITGLNFVTLPTASYAKGCYIIKTKINDKLFIKKFIKITHQ
ncbi:MAG: PKD domain-containing protein [Bacteroidetes bacterium]|nr:PKD domain-containing protein [Bacteroidota bacterium]